MQWLYNKCSDQIILLYKKEEKNINFNYYNILNILIKIYIL